MRTESPSIPARAVGVGTSRPRIDGIAKTQGAFAFASDLSAESMLWGATARSPHPRARIRSIDVTRAACLPGVRAVLTAGDVPGTKTFGLEFRDQPVLAWDDVRYTGEPIAVLAAETPELARTAAQLVDVEYEVLPALLDMEEALRADATQLHEYGNVVRHIRIEHGVPDADADVWVEGYYETAMQDQAFLGPEAGLALPGDDGGIDLFVASQWLHIDRKQLAPCLDLPEERVRLHLGGVGGAFGAREDISIHIHASLLALRTGRPVKMTYGREESFVGHVHRHPARIWMRHGATRDGRLVVVRARLLFDAGAYTSTSGAVTLVGSCFAAGPYEVPNALLEGTSVYTNNPPAGAMRGFGAVQACFAHEAQMDKLAGALGVDPVDLRLRNALAPGSKLPFGQTITGTAPVRELLERCRAIPLPPEREKAPPIMLSLPGGAGNTARRATIRRGIGYAAGYKNIALGNGADDHSTARVKLSRGADGTVAAEVHSAASECGQGIHTILLQIAEEELGVPALLHPSDTNVGSAGSSSASKQTMLSGGAVQAACRAIRDELFRRAAKRAGSVGPFELHAGAVVANGMHATAIDDLLSDPIEETVVYRPPWTQPLDERGQGDAFVCFAFAVQRAVVDVDVDLGLVRVVQIASAQDVGRAINPQSVEGQIEGGTAQGLGLALMEEVQVEDGVIRNGSFTDYLIPTILDMPEVEHVLVEEPEPGVPFGAKGVGEPPTVVSTAAIVGALRDAVGRELHRAPVSPEELAGLLKPPGPRAWPPSPDVPGPRPVLEYLGFTSERHV